MQYVAIRLTPPSPNAGSHNMVWIIDSSPDNIWEIDWQSPHLRHPEMRTPQ